MCGCVGGSCKATQKKPAAIMKDPGQRLTDPNNKKDIKGPEKMQSIFKNP